MNLLNLFFSMATAAEMASGRFFFFFFKAIMVRCISKAVSFSRKGLYCGEMGRQKQGRGLVDHKQVQVPPPPPPVIFIAGRPKAALLFFGSLVILDVARCYLLLFTLYINIKIGKNSCKMLD